MIGGLMKSASRFALVATAGILISGVASPSAKAADLGGNCCADLEERVAELEATTARKGNRKVSLTVSGQINRSILFWDDGFESDVYSVDNALSNSRFRFTGNAKITPALTAGFLAEFDLSLGSRSHQVNQIDDDGINANTGGGLGGAVGGDGLGGAGDSMLGWTLANWYMTHKDYGTLTVGRLNTASAGIGIIDLGGIGVIANSQAFLWGGGFLLRNGAGKLSNAAPVGFSNVWGQLSCGPSGAGPYNVDCGIHALSRRDAVRYDTPTWMGFTAGAAWGENDYWDAALRYANEFSGWRFAAGVGYRRYEDREPDAFNAIFTGPVADTDRRMWIASGSLLHIASGIFVDAAWYQYEFRGFNANELFAGDPALGNRPDTEFWYVAGGISQNWFGIGKTALYGEYGRTNDGTTGTLAQNGDVAGALGSLNGLGPLANGAFAAGTVVLDSEMTYWGFGVVQNIDAAAMELYLAYRNYSADILVSGGAVNQIPGGIEDIHFVQGGARIQF